MDWCDVFLCDLATGLWTTAGSPDPSSGPHSTNIKAAIRQLSIFVLTELSNFYRTAQV